jgi:DNA-binding NarL/FixJ family response regulator
MTKITPDPEHTMPAIRILLVDDQSIILDGLEALIAQNDDFVVCGRANNGREALEKTKELKPDVVLMDINMPEMDGIEATKQIKRSADSPEILVLSMYNNVEFVREMLDAGASGYVLKNTGRVELREAILAVASKQRYLAKPVQDILDASYAVSAARPEGEGYSSLTKREKEIVKLIVDMKTSSEMAEILGLSAATIDTHRKNILHKLNIHSTAGVVRYGMERGWGDMLNTTEK